MNNAEELTLNEIYEIAETCCNKDCGRFRAGTCTYQGRDKVSCYLWQIAREEYREEREAAIIYVTCVGKNVVGVSHSLQRAKRCIDHLQNLDGCVIISEKVAMGDVGGVYHLQLHRWEHHGTWQRVC